MLSHRVFGQLKKNDQIQSLFDKICDLARNQKENELHALIASGVSINLYCGLLSPIAQLALEGNDVAVDWLLDKFGANPYLAMWGSACRGDNARVNYLINEVVGNPYYAIYGYIIGGYFKEAEALLDHALSKHDLQAVKYAFLGYGLIGNDRRVDELYEKCRELRLDVNSYLFAVSWAYAISGQKKMLDEFKTRYQYVPHQYYIISHAIVGFAQGGYVEEVNAYLKTNGKIYSSDNVFDALRGFAMAGDSENINKLNQDYQSESALLEAAENALMAINDGYAKLGLGNYINDQDGALTEKAFVGFCSGYHLSLINQAFAKKNYAEDVVNNISANLRIFFHNPTIALRTLSFIQNDELRKELAWRAPLICMKEGIKALLPRATIIHRLMTNKQLDYKECLAMTDLTQTQREAASKPEVQTWLLECLKLIERNDKRPGLPLELFLSVVDYLSPMTSRERNDLWAKYFNYSLLYPNLAASYARLFSQQKTISPTTENNLEADQGCVPMTR